MSDVVRRHDDEVLQGETMKWCRFTADGATTYGLIEGERVRKVDGAPWERHTVTAESNALGDAQPDLPAAPSTPSLCPSGGARSWAWRA